MKELSPRNFNKRARAKIDLESKLIYNRKSPQHNNTFIDAWQLGYSASRQLRIELPDQVIGQSMMEELHRLGQTTKALVYMRGRWSDKVTGAAIVALKIHINNQVALDLVNTFPEVFDVQERERLTQRCGFLS